MSHTARVFLDGREIGGHHNAFTGFAIELPDLEEGEHELRVHISNEHGEISALHVPNDYYDYGGINRPVELQILETDCYLEWLHLTPVAVEGGWKAEVKVRLTNLGADLVAGLLVVLLGEERVEQEMTLQPGVHEQFMTFDCPGVKTWSHESPALYEILAEWRVNGEAVDDLIDRVGFRTSAVRGHDLLINSESVRLFGFNRHEDHPLYGNAIPLEQIRKDLELVRESGANAVRTSHYPNDQRFLDLCDEMGIYVWEENHARGLFPGSRAGSNHPHPRFKEQCQDCNVEMVSQHFNHPCIVIWGILNECDSFTGEGRRDYEEQFAQIRELDPSRPVTYAACHFGTDRCQDLPDISSWNRYFGWYDQSTPAMELPKFLEWLDSSPAKDKPFIMSEFGGGGIPGFRDPVRRGKWSEDRQADLMDESLAAFGSHPRICGLFIWQFCDVRVDEKWAMQRPRTMNNKGIVDEWRRPKLAWEVVKKHFHALRSRKPD